MIKDDRSTGELRAVIWYCAQLLTLYRMYHPSDPELRERWERLVERRRNTVFRNSPQQTELRELAQDMERLVKDFRQAILFVREK